MDKYYYNSTLNNLLNSEQEDTYGSCVKQELVKIFEQRLNCTPPLLASETDQMCNERINVTHNESKAISEFFVNNYIDFEPSECKRPCTQTTYDVHVNAKAEQNYLLMKLTFKSLIHVTRSLYTTTVLEAITSLGGSVRSFFCWNIIDNFQLTKQRNRNDIIILESFIIGALWCL